MNLIQQIEENFKNLLQQEAIFSIKNKNIKRGKILLFNLNEFLIEFTLEDLKDQKIKKFNIPLPYAIECHIEDKLIYCDYRLITLARKDEELLKLLQKVGHVSKSRFYNTILQIDTN